MLEIATYVRPGVIGGAFGTGEIKLLSLGRKLKNLTVATQPATSTLLPKNT
jgi:hypothetical protein